MRDLDLLRLERRVGLMLAPLGDGGPGAAVGVARDGALLLRRAAGFASLELGVPIGPGTTFRIASVSKQFTCAAALLLAREGRLSLADPLGRFLPELPPALAAVTFDQALRNCSGARDHLELLRLGGTDIHQPAEEEDIAAVLAMQRGGNFPPGARFLYSNTGFRLAGRAIERAAGESLAAFLERRVFFPLGMTRTRHVADLAAPVPGLATGYLPDGRGGWRRAPHGVPVGGEGGLVSGVEDLALWTRNLSLGLLGDGLEQELETNAPFANGHRNRYALGLEEDEWRGLRTVSHGGLWPGYKTAFLRIPERRLTVIVIANNAALDPHHMAHQIMEAALDGQLAPVPAAVDARPLAGSWACEAGLSLDVALDQAGTATATMHGIAFALDPAPDGRLKARRGSFPFLARAVPEGVEVEVDAGVRHLFRRAEPGAPVPAALSGRWFCDELATEWAVEGDRLAVRGPFRNAAGWRVEALALQGRGGGHLRVHVPSPVWPTWADATLAGDRLTVNGSRCRGLVFSRAG
jgi:CubicO group peptidase (beta-lactamase class C family)